MTTTISRRRALAAGAASAACAISAPGFVLGQTRAAPVAATRAGRVRGTVVDGINVFKGIRYGANTGGSGRFKPPQPPQPWSEVRDALDYADQAPQQPGGDGGGLFRDWSNRKPNSEDCLFLNVWTPGLRDGGKRPVMVWFHGGGFSTGSGSSHAYDGVRLGKRGDVVVVTVNHRLNVFGYSYLAELGGVEFADSGNVGNLDMIQSLRWVRDNIAEFGGDPNRVLIFGESGGGSKVSCLMAMPGADGLFHRAVVQSGSTLRVREPQAATASARQWVTGLGLQPGQMRELQALPMDRLVQAITASGAASNPVVDGRSLPRHPFDPDAPYVSRNVPMLIGTTKDENTLLQGARDRTLFDLTWDTLPARLGEALPGLDAARVVSEMRRLHPQASPADIYFRSTTERGFRRSAITQAERKSAQAARGGAPAWFYWLTWETPVDGGRWNSPHALDIALMFDNVAKSASMTGTGAEAQRVADAMSAAWIRFARSGNPGWAPYTPQTRTTMVFDVNSRTVNDPARAERLLFGAA